MNYIGDLVSRAVANPIVLAAAAATAASVAALATSSHLRKVVYYDVLFFAAYVAVPKIVYWILMQGLILFLLRKFCFC
jgi:hypothetical protein